MFLLSITEKNLLYSLPTGYTQLQDFPHPEPCLFQMKQRIFKEYLDQIRNQCKCKKQTKTTKRSSISTMALTVKLFI